MKEIILLQDAAAEGASPYSSLIMFGLIGIVFYFFMIRPQMKRTKEARLFRESLAQGDKIVTVGGIHGKVLEINDSTVLISSEGSKIRVSKSSIASNEAEALENKQQR